MTAEEAARAAFAGGVEALRRGQVEQAAAQFRQFLQAAPGHPDGQHLLANALGQLGELDEARALVEKAIARDGRRGAFHNTLGNILKQQGASREALRAYARALDLEPKMIGAWFNLGLIHLDDERFDDAADAFDQVLRVAPGNFDALVHRGQVAWRLGQLDVARQHFESALRCRDDSWEAHNYLGVVSLHSGDVAQARDLFERAHALAPDQGGPRLNLAKARRGEGDLDGAAQVLNDALSTRPEDAAFLSELGGVRLAQGDVAKAKQLFLAALNVRDEPVTAAALAELYLWDGMAERGVDVLTAWPDEAAPQVAIARARLALAGKRDAASVAGLEHWLLPAHASEVSAQAKQQLHYCAGDVQHAAADYAAAFAHFQAANDMAASRFDMTAHARGIDDLIDFFGESAWSSLAHTNAADVGPVFIVGMPRSGTSLIEQMLSMHPQIQALGERVDVGQWPQRLTTDGAWPAVLEQATIGQLNTLARDYLTAQDFAPDAAWITDKMPLNYLHLGVIAMVFPNARIVHCQRHTEAIALSCYRQDFSDPALAFTCDLSSLGEYVAHYERLMAHWHTSLPLPIFDLHYESLVAEPESVLRALLASLDLPFDPACLAFHQSARFVHTASNQQVRKPLYTSAVDTHARYARHLEPFTLALAQHRAQAKSESS